MNNTFQILLHWDKGQAASERLSSKILDLEGYENIDPQCPLGGPDGTKDILCYKDGVSYVAGCYFPIGQNSFNDIKKKFDDDFVGVSKNKADGLVFITNQKISPSERNKLTDGKGKSIVYHSERVISILDSPRGYGVRLEYLNIELSKEEQISYLNAQVDLKKQSDQISEMLEELKKVTVFVEGYISKRDMHQSKLFSVLPIAGVPASSRLSIEDIQMIHSACLYGTDLPINYISNGFRNVQVWIGDPGCSPDKSDFIPTEPSAIPTLMVELLQWWREVYIKVVHANIEAKKTAIAEFHERFLTIHPFIDGNGRVARTIATMQYKDLLNEVVVLDEMNRSEYYESLQEAREGDYSKLVNIMDNLAK